MALTKPTDGQLTTSSATFFSTSGNDALVLGTNGNDIITGGTILLDSADSDGVDSMEGGLGDDVYIVRDTADAVLELAGEGTDTVWTSVSYTLGAEVENIGANGGADITLTGNAKDNILDGTQATGVITMAGSSGNDTYFFGSGDKIIETGGFDTLYMAEDAGNIDLTNATTAAAILGGTAAQQAITVAGIDNVILQQGTTSDGNITGNALSNRLVGSAGNNNLNGGTAALNGNDILDTGAAGNDTLNGGAGNDTYIIREAATLASLSDSAGIDVIKSYNGSSINLTTFSGIENVFLLGTLGSVTGGNALANKVTGNSGANLIETGAGNDTLTGGSNTAGADTMRGGDGSDTYFASNSGDIIEETNAAAAGGVDIVHFNGTSGNLIIGPNVETIILDGTSDIGARVTSGTTNNTMTGNSGDNTLEGFGGNDTISGLAGDDSIEGGDGNDSLNGGDGDDTINGGAGNDTLIGGAGTNTLDGGDGNDTYTVIATGSTISETNAAAAGGVDIVNFSGTSGSLAVGANIETVNLLGTSDISVVVTGTTNNTITGNTGANSMNGGAGNDTITGGSGDDTLLGGLGNDSLTGGVGADSMAGGGNNDIYNVDNTSDIVSEVGGNGSDTVSSSVSYTLNSTAAAGVETLTLTSAATALNATGNDINNTINGNTLNNTIDGLAGNDTIIAGSGNDTVTGGTGRDVVTVGLGNDTIVLANGDSLGAAASVAGIDLFSDLTLNAGTADKIDLAVTVVNIATAITVADVSEATFVDDMNAVLSATGAGFAQTAGGIDVALVTVDSGDLTGSKFLAVDLDASGTYTATDLMIEITGSTVTSLTAATFV